MWTEVLTLIEWASVLALLTHGDKEEGAWVSEPFVGIIVRRRIPISLS
jgi:hypothetical protein